MYAHMHIYIKMEYLKITGFYLLTKLVMEHNGEKYCIPNSNKSDEIPRNNLTRTMKDLYE